MEQLLNQIRLWGTLAAPPEYSHSNHGRAFYQFYLDVERLSGARDRLPITAPEDLLARAELTPGSGIAVTGQIRSFNNRSGQGRRLIITVYAQTLEICDDVPCNLALLTGNLCKPPVFRRTPLGREICDGMLAVNRPYHRTDYLPCIFWGRTALEVSRLPVGAELSLEGRLQSREYVKVLESGNERRTAYEISVISAQLPEEEL